MSSGRLAEVRTPLILAILMVLMTQVGYLDLMNTWSGDEETLDSSAPIAQSSPANSVVYGNNSMWVTGSDGPIRNTEYIAIGTDAVLFQGTHVHTSRVGCAMAYSTSNYSTWVPNTASSSSCTGMVGRYVGMVDGLTYFTYHATFSSPQANNDQRGDLHAYNPANDTIYLVSSHSNLVKTAVVVGRTIYIATQSTIAGTTSSFFAYNVDNQTTWALPVGNLPASQLMVIGTKIFNHASFGANPSNIDSKVFNTENGTWYTVPSLPAKGRFGDPAAGLVSNGQLLFIGSDSATNYQSSGAYGGNGSEYWIYDSNNDTAWPLGDFCTSVVYNNVCDGALRFAGDWGLPHIRDGTEMYFIGRSHMTSTANADTYDLWGYSTTNSTHWHMTNLSTIFDQVKTSPYSSGRFAYINLAMLDNGEFVIASQRSSGYESAFYSPTNDTLWQPVLETSDSMGYDVQVQYARLLGVYGNTLYFVSGSSLVAYNAANQTGVGQTIPGSSPQYLHGPPLLFGSTFAMANQCGHGTAISCPQGQRNTILQWQPESVTVSDAWNLTPGQRIDGPITGGNGIHFDSGVGVQNLTASAEGAELTVGLAMTNITFGTSSASSSSLALGYNHACGLLDNGSVKCWGDYANGRLGNGATQDIGDDSGEMGDALPVSKLGTGRTATSISSGLPTTSPHTCAVLDDGSVKCWGYNQHGQLGIGNTTTMGDTFFGRMGDNLSAVDLGTGRTAVDVSVGDRFSCALLDNGDVKCWGRNSNGQLGIGNTTHMGDDANEMGDNLASVDLGTGRTAVGIATGYDLSLIHI